jgi:hypothetical protein
MQNFIITTKSGIARHFQAWNSRRGAPVRQAEDIFKLKLEPTCFTAMSPFYVNAAVACRGMNLIVNPSIGYVADIKAPTQQETC